MRYLRLFIIAALFVGMPATLLADIGSLPAASRWYFHADFEEMRSSEAGQHLYGWLQGEVFDEIRDEAGVNLDKEADTLTAYSMGDDELVVVIDGNLSQETEDKVLALSASSGTLDKLGSGRNTYYHIKDNPDDEISLKVDGLDDGLYFSFAVDKKLIVTSSVSDMESMIASKGRVKAGRSGTANALFIISAERNLMQAGVKAGDIGDEIGWNSNILRNTKQAAMLVSDEDGKLAFEAQLVTSEKEMANSLASIARGIISLQVFNDELDPEIAEFLRSTKVDVDDNTLVIKALLDPETVVETLD